MQNSGHAVELEDLKKDIEAIRAELNHFSEDVRDLTHSKWRDMSDETEKIADKVKARAEHAVSSSKKTLKSSVDDFETTVRARPMTSVAAAFGLGVLLSKLMEK